MGGNFRNAGDVGFFRSPGAADGNLTTLDIILALAVFVVFPATCAYLARREEKERERKLEVERTDDAGTFFPDAPTELELRQYATFETDDERDFFPERRHPRGGTGLYETGDGE